MPEFRLNRLYVETLTGKTITLMFKPDDTRDYINADIHATRKAWPCITIWLSFGARHCQRMAKHNKL